jgi:hypothetical protein
MSGSMSKHIDRAADEVIMPSLQEIIESKAGQLQIDPCAGPRLVK